MMHIQMLSMSTLQCGLSMIVCHSGYPPIHMSCHLNSSLGRSHRRYTLPGANLGVGVTRFPQFPRGLFNNPDDVTGRQL